MKSEIKSIEKVSVEFNKEKALDDLVAAEKEYKNASSVDSKALSKYKKLYARFREAREGDFVTEKLSADMQKAHKRHEITSARKAKATLAKDEARIYYRTRGQARTRDEQIAYLEKSYAELMAYQAKERAIDKEAKK